MPILATATKSGGFASEHGRSIPIGDIRSILGRTRLGWIIEDEALELPRVLWRRSRI